MITGSQPTASAPTASQGQSSSIGEAVWAQLEFLTNCCGLLSLHDGSGELARLDVHGTTLDDWHTLRVCYVDVLTNIVRAELTTASGDVFTIHATTEHDEGKRAGIGTGTVNGSLAFDNFVFYVHDSEHRLCPVCESTPCLIFLDKFDREPCYAYVSGALCGWETISGDWEAASDGYLTVSDSDAMLVGKVVNPDGPDMVTEVRLLGKEDDQIRGVVCYQDADNYLAAEVEIGECGNFRLIQVSAGVETVLGAVALFDAIADNWFTLRICYTPPGYGTPGLLGANLTDDFERAATIEANVDVSAGDRAGVATGTITSAVRFDDFKLYENGCQVCAADDGCHPVFDPIEFTGYASELSCFWEEVSGDWWSVDSAVVEGYQTGIAVVAVENDSSVMFAEVHVDLPTTGDTARLIVDYLDEDHYHFAKVTQGTDFGMGTPKGELSAWIRSGGTETQIGPTREIAFGPVSGVGTPEIILLRACMKEDILAVEMLWADTFVGNNITGGSTTSHGGRRAGIGIDSITSVARFSDFFSSNLVNSEADVECAYCHAYCGSCDVDSMPPTGLLIDLGFFALTDDTADYCDQIGGVYTLTNMAVQYPAGSPCSYQYHSGIVETWHRSDFDISDWVACFGLTEMTVNFRLNVITRIIIDGSALRWTAWIRFGPLSTATAQQGTVSGTFVRSIFYESDDIEGRCAEFPVTLNLVSDDFGDPIAHPECIASFPFCGGTPPSQIQILGPA